MTPTVVVGGGPAAAVAATLLARAGADVVVLAGSPARRPPGELLPAAATPLLRRLGAWPTFAASGHARSPGTLSSWGRAALGGRLSLVAPHGTGWRIDRARFDATLLDVAGSAGADVRRNVAVLAVAEEAGGVALRCRRERGDETVRAGLVVDATGRARRVARALGARAAHGDRLVAFTAVVPGDVGDERACVEAFAEGWWYRVAIGSDRHAVVCFTDADLPAARVVRHPGGLATMLAATHHLGDLVEGASRAAPPCAVPAGTSWLLVPTGPRWIAVGDAAAALDPLAGRGLLDAMLGASAAACAISRSIDGYDRWITARRVRQRAEQAAVYRLEHRWAEQPFWARRREGLQPRPRRDHSGGEMPSNFM